MIKLPLTAREGLSGVWIEDAHGITIADINPLLDRAEALRIAELLASGAGFLDNRRKHAARMTELARGLGGRPRTWEPRKLLPPPRQKRGRPRKPRKPKEEKE